MKTPTIVLDTYGLFARAVNGVFIFFKPSLSEMPLKVAICQLIISAANFLIDSYSGGFRGVMGSLPPPHTPQKSNTFEKLTRDRNMTFFQFDY